jgi:hypothetical protein
MAKTYWEKLQDPQWQRKRLEVMKEAGFRCQCCGNDEETLNVHHKEYFKSYEPWEYDNSQLAVLCKSCHEATHDYLDLYKWVGSYANLDGPNNRQELAFVLCGYIGYSLEDIAQMMGIELDTGTIKYYKSGKCAKAYYEHLSNKSLEGEKNA